MAIKPFFHRAVVLTICLGLVFLITGYLIILHYSNKSTYHGDNNTSVVISASNAGIIEFKKPASFGAVDTSAKGKAAPIQYYQQTETINSKEVATSHLEVATAPVNISTYATLNSFNRYLMEPKTSKDYMYAAAPITSVVWGLLENYPTIKIDNATVFRTAKITKNAWIFNISATGATGNLPDQEGRAIYAWTTKAAYFYVLTVASSQWQANLSSWQSMINSISLE